MWTAWTQAKGCCGVAGQEVEKRMCHYPYLLYDGDQRDGSGDGLVGGCVGVEC